MNKKSFSPLSLSALLLSIALSSGCSTMTDKQAVESESTEATIMHDYPTRDRVEYVFNCIAKHGGNLFDYVSRYNCGCKIDKIAEQLTFEEFEAATTFSMLRSTPGENGAVFRDPQQSKDLRKRLKAAEESAENRCFV